MHRLPVVHSVGVPPHRYARPRMPQLGRLRRLLCRTAAASGVQLRTSHAACLARAAALSAAGDRTRTACRWHAAGCNTVPLHRVQRRPFTAPGQCHTNNMLQHGTPCCNAAQDVAQRGGVRWRRRHRASARTCAAPPMRRRFRSVKKTMQPTALFAKAQTHKHAAARRCDAQVPDRPQPSCARVCVRARACACAGGWVGRAHA